VAGVHVGTKRTYFTSDTVTYESLSTQKRTILNPTLTVNKLKNEEIPRFWEIFCLEVTDWCLIGYIISFTRFGAKKGYSFGVLGL
jgi:hypothetical protein